MNKPSKVAVPISPPCSCVMNLLFTMSGISAPRIV